MSNMPTVIVLRETALQSVISDTYSLACALVLIGLGVYLQSDPMQWLGFLFVAMSFIARAKGKARQTPQQAADYLRDEFDVVAERKP